MLHRTGLQSSGTVLRSCAGGRSSVEPGVASRLASSGVVGVALAREWRPEAALCVEEAQGSSPVNLEKCPLGPPGYGPCFCLFILNVKDYKRHRGRRSGFVSNDASVLHN